MTPPDALTHASRSLTLLHLSDPHFGTERPAVVSSLLTWVKEIARPDVVVVSGDLTQRATADQFAQVKTFVQALRAEHVLTMVGNHDVPLFDWWARWKNPYGRYRRALGDALEATFESPELLLLTLNTTRWWRHKHGELSRQQIEDTSARLRNAKPEQLRVVVTHQPCAVPCDTERNNLVRGAEAALVAWSTAGADLVLGGHIHWPAVIPFEPALRHAARRAWVVLAGTAVSSRIRRDDGNSCNLIHWDTVAGRCEVERWDFVDETPDVVAPTSALARLDHPERRAWQRVSVESLDVDRP